MGSMMVAVVLLEELALGLRELTQGTEDDPMFPSPSDLWEFSMATVADLRTAGLEEAAATLEAATTYVTGSGWEWLGELGLATASIRRRSGLPRPIAERVKQIHKAATSRRPYG